jgi:predicted NACHT family NTPase
MALTEILVTKLGTRLGKILLKAYLEDPSEAIGSDLLDVAKVKIESFLDRKEAKRQFERIGEKIAAQLEPLFEHEFRRNEMGVEAVINELAEALNGKISPGFFLRKDFDPAKITAELKSGRPLPRGQFSAAEEQLYERVLAEAIRYVVEVADKLPKFQVAHIKESLQRLSNLSEVVEETSKGVKRIEDWVHRQESDAEAQQFEVDYRLAIIRRLDRLELFGADLSPESKRQSLSAAYVSLNLQAGEEDRAEPLPVEAVLNNLSPNSSRLLVRGEAGSGKSTLFRWIAVRSAQAPLARTRYGFLRSFKVARSDSLPSWMGCLPFFVRLRDCKGGKLPSPEDFPALIASEIGSPPEKWVLSVLRSGRAILLLDGIDEIPNAHRASLLNEVEALIGAYPANYVLVSTRPLAVPDGWLASEGFHEARVNPMSEVDRERFIGKWHEAVAVELRRIGKPADDLPRLAADLTRALLENPPIARLATNPLLCAMVCALHRDRSQKLPESQAELCGALCEILLHRRERESGLDLSEFPEPYKRLLYPQKKAIVQEIAHYMVLNGESSITVSRAEEKVSNALRALAGQSEEDAPVVCESIVERSGMLRETRPGHLDFIHNTFKEYLAGERFANTGDAGLLAGHALDPAWQRVIQLAVATPRQGFADDVIRRILRSESRAVQLLALQCRAAALFIDPLLEGELDALAKSLFPPRNMGDAEALAAAGDLAVPFLAYRRNLGVKKAAASIRTLRLLGTPRARLTLEGYFEEDRQAVLAELAHAVNPLLLKAVRRALAEGGVLSASIRSQIRDLEPLSDLVDLQRLDLRGTQVFDISPLAGLSNLKILDLSGTDVFDIAPLAGLSNLQSLDLSGAPVDDVSALAGLSNLQNLALSWTGVLDISPLSHLSSLQSLDLSLTLIVDVSPLAGLANLRSLDLSGPQLTDVSPLAHLTDLLIEGV